MTTSQFIVLRPGIGMRSMLIGATASRNGLRISLEAPRNPPMPIGRQLILVRDTKQLRFLEIVRHELQSDRAVLRAEAAGEAHSRDTGQTTWNGVEVRQVHGNRVGGFLAESER